MNLSWHSVLPSPDGLWGWIFMMTRYFSEFFLVELSVFLLVTCKKVADMHSVSQQMASERFQSTLVEIINFEGEGGEVCKKPAMILKIKNHCYVKPPHYHCHHLTAITSLTFITWPASVVQTEHNVSQSPRFTYQWVCLYSIHQGSLKGTPVMTQAFS